MMLASGNYKSYFANSGICYSIGNALKKELSQSVDYIFSSHLGLIR